MECSVGVSLLEGISLVEHPGNVVSVTAPVHLFRQGMSLTNVTTGLHAALKRLQTQSLTPPALMALVLQTDGMTGLARLTQYINKLEQYAFLRRQLQADGVPLATIRPLSVYYHYEESKVDPDQQYVLSRFALLRNEQNRMILECPLGHAQIECQSPIVLGILHALKAPARLKDVVQAVPGLQEDCALVFMNFLVSAKAIAPASSESAMPEDTDPVLAPWEFHDMLFHSRSRLGRHDRPYGGTFPFKDKLPQLPVIKKAMSTDVTVLYRPELEELKKTDVPFTAVLERRASVREQGEVPITVQQLGEFLYRSARVKFISEEGGVSFRPSPGGGALHELEIYAFVDRCEGLASGLYHYNPLKHELHKISDPNPFVNTLIKLAAITARQEINPQVLLTISARFQRVQHKYQSMTYAVILKNLGALYQTMHLVGTAMGLATSALGGGHADIFAQAANLNYFEETSVGEFILENATHGSVAN